MCRRGILLVIISLGIIVHTAENNLEINSGYPIELHMMNLESELKSDAAESSYTRVIVWNTMPNSEDLEHHFNKFNLLQLKERELTSEKLDIIEKNESTYERFLYAYFSEQQWAVTIFVKVNFNSKRDSFSLKNFIERVNAALKKYGLIDKDVIVRDQIHSDNSTSWNRYIALIVFITLLLLIIIWMIICRPLASFYNKNKNKGCMDDNRNEYWQELREHEEKLAIQLKSLHEEHPDLAISYENIGNVRYNMGDYHQALSSYEKALAIQEMSLPENHPDLARSFNKIGAVHEKMNNYSKAKSFYDLAIQISGRSLSKSDPGLAKYRKDLERVKKKL